MDIKPRANPKLSREDHASTFTLCLSSLHTDDLDRKQRAQQHSIDMPAAPAPFHILRNHSSPLSALSINPSNTLLYTGDQDGNVGITDLSSRRVVRLWKAHNESILSVEEWNGHLLR